MKPSDVAAIIAGVVAVAVVIGSYVIHLQEFWGGLPWVLGLAAFGGAWGSIVEGMAHGNQADRR